MVKFRVEVICSDTQCIHSESVHYEQTESLAHETIHTWNAQFLALGIPNQVRLLSCESLSNAEVARELLHRGG